MILESHEDALSNARISDSNRFVEGQSILPKLGKSEKFTLKMLDDRFIFQNTILLNEITFQNMILVSEIRDLKKQNEDLQIQLKTSHDEIDYISQQLREKEKQEKLVEEKRVRRKNRKRQVPKEPINEDIDNLLIEESNRTHRKTYYGARLRLVLAILILTGVRISELLPVTVEQIQTLFEDSWIAIDRSKRGPASHKAFLPSKGKKLLKDRRMDFEILLTNKDKHSLVFTSSHSDQSLTRESLTRTTNHFLTNVSLKLPNQPFIRSHSFRIGFITSLWKDQGDIEFVKQVIGHVKIDTTSRYISNLTEEERRDRMTQKKS